MIQKIATYVATGYYEAFLARYYQYVIPQGAQARFLDDVDDINAITFYDEYIVVRAGLILQAYDLDELLKSIRAKCSDNVRIFIEYTHWLYTAPFSIFYTRPVYTYREMVRALDRQGYTLITMQEELLVPLYIPGVSWLLNYCIARMPLVRTLCYHRILTVQLGDRRKNKDYTVSVIIPCKNEAGTMDQIAQRCPVLGLSTELIFVEGHSRDNTIEVLMQLEREYREHSSKKIRWVTQSGKGKLNAVLEGFNLATSDIVMILDGDMTVLPEELSRFYELLACGKAGMVNGNRLLYPMPYDAMQWLNWFANHAFALIYRTLLGQFLGDTLCGTKAFFKKDYQTILAGQRFYKTNDPFGDFDLLCGASYAHLKIIDLPVHYQARTYGVTQIRRFYHGLQLLKVTWRVFCKVMLRR